ncbi:UDP-galactose transmembrane transporter [Fragilaria crotonensis]|nr:UDP-galactose transmembrane transporter [Fragilaria crotonensis]
MKCSPQSNAALQRGPVALIICSIGICCCYICYGILQEQYFSGSNRIGANFALVSQTATNALVALGWSRVEKLWGKGETATSNLGLNHPLLLVTSLCYIAAMSTSNYAFRYVGYPTAVLAKSCKLIPTMFMSIFIERKRYSLHEWTAAGCITLGIVLFNLSRLSSVSDDKQDSLHGLILLFVSLCMDGFLGSCQGLLKRSDLQGKRRPPTAMETMLYVNVYALVWIVPVAIQSGEWADGMSRLDEIKHGMILLNATAASGQIFIFLTLTWFSPLICTTITTTRKFFTILISVLHFGHVFTPAQWSAVVLVFGGLYTGIADQARGKKKVKDH